MHRFLPFFPLFVSALCAQVSIVGPIESRFATADLVCRGSVISAITTSQVGIHDDNGKLKPVDYLVRFSSDWCYKGEPQTREITINILKRSPMQGNPFHTGEYLLTFLNGSGPDYTFSNIDESFVRSWPIDPPPDPGAKGLSQLEADILQVVGGGDIARSKQAFEILLQFEQLSPRVESFLRRFKTSSNDELRILSLEAQVLAVGTTTDASVSSKPLVKMDTPAFVRRRAAIRDFAAALRGRGDSKARISEGIGRILADDTGVDDLEILEEIVTTSPVANLRLYAMLGIRRLAERQTLSFLVSQLDATDTMMQFQAIMALAEITGKGGEYGPGMDLFDKDPGKYSSIWKKWWREVGTHQ